MIYLESIHISKFKGVKDLTCEFEDITLLAGLNNSGKTTILQAVHLLTAALPTISSYQHAFHDDPNTRRINLGKPLASLGLQNVDMLLPHMERGADSTLIGWFSQGLSIELKPIANTQFQFTVSSNNNFPKEELQRLLSQTTNYSAEFVTPPGTVTSREDMMPQGNYQGMLAQGKGSQLWRNAIWWSVQQEGYEAFESVKALVTRYFPDVEVLQPTLGISNPPEILLTYKERSGVKLDIAQSGAGLRTFLTLARLLEQSSASILLLDEPDAHLHASQQVVVINLLMDTALEQGKQVIIASHSPEFIVRTPVECLRWIEPGNPNAQPDEMRMLLERLGVTPDVHLTGHKFPAVIVYVEGKTDKPVMESLVAWCRQKHPELPSVTVATHRDGRFDAPALQAISRVIKEMKGHTRIVGIRDRDWYYHELPSAEPEVKSGDGWVLLTLPCKELENLFCDPEFLFSALAEKIPISNISQIIDGESQNETLVNEWGNQIKPRIRNALSSHYSNATKEEQTDNLFITWKNDPQIRRRLVAGKELLRRVRGRLKDEFHVNRYSQRMFEHVQTLTPVWAAIAGSIFSGIDFSTTTDVSKN